jgi:hypothetical protein
MTNKRSIQIKASLLLVIFALNTVVGFACSVGLDMGFNTSHHKKDAEEGSVHIHKDGKKHIHKKEATEKKHHSQKAAASKKDDCCKEKVVKLQNADKSFQYSKTTIDVPVYLIPKSDFRLAVFHPLDPYLQEQIACHFHPPPRDIRIAIQSFQI